MRQRIPRFQELDAALGQEPRSERSLWLARRQRAGRRLARAARDPRRKTLSPTERRRLYLTQAGRLDQLRAEGLI